MKNFFTILFSFYIIALSCATCECDEILEFQNKTEITQNHSHSENQKSDSCSPFCTCACCTSSVFYFQTISLQFKPQLKINVVKTFPIVNQRFATFNLQNIWQPPKNC